MSSQDNLLKPSTSLGSIMTFESKEPQWKTDYQAKSNAQAVKKIASSYAQKAEQQDKDEFARNWRKKYGDYR